MVFSMGNKVLPDIIDEIANGLMATTGGYWTDADVAWSTSDRRAGFDNARRALKYTNGTETIYLALESINADKQPYLYWNPVFYHKGLRVTFSSTWDGTGHIYGTTRQQSFIMFEGKHRDVAPGGGVRADLATLMITHYLWIESNGFVIMGRPAPFAEDIYQGSFIVVVERSPTKEYIDIYTNFYCYNRNNHYETNAPRSTVAMNGLRLESMMRPFAYVSGARKEYDQNPEGAYIDTYQYLQRIWDTTYLGFPYDPRGIQFPLLAYKGIKDGKVRFIKPIVHNSIIVQGNRHSMEFDPIFSSELFFAFRDDGGIADGDIIQVDGTTKKYLCKSLDSADMVTRLNYAMKYSD